MNIEFKFDLKQKVKVTLLGLEAYINAYYVENSGEKKYQLEWLTSTNVVNNRYFGEDEIEPVE